MKDIILQSIPGVVTAVIAAYIAAQWSLQKLYSEKWWDRKERAYSDIISCLYDIMQHYEYQRDHHGHDRQLSTEKEKELTDNYDKSYWKIKKFTDIGGFVISPMATNILNDLKNRPRLNRRENPPWEVYDQDYTYYKKALEEIVIIANNDLKATKA